MRLVGATSQVQEFAHRNEQARWRNWMFFIRELVPLWSARLGSAARNCMREISVRVQALPRLLISRWPALEMRKRTFGETIAHALVVTQITQGHGNDRSKRNQNHAARW